MILFFFTGIKTLSVYIGFAHYTKNALIGLDSQLVIRWSD